MWSRPIRIPPTKSWRQFCFSLALASSQTAELCVTVTSFKAPNPAITILAIKRLESFTCEAIAAKIKSSSPVIPVRRKAPADQSAPTTAIADPDKVPMIAAPVFKLKP